MDNVLEMKRPDPFAKADAAFQKGIDAYIEWGQEMAKLNEAGHTQQELGGRYHCAQSQIGQAIKVGSDPRIICNTDNLPKDKTVLYMLSTLDDKDFEEIARPDLRQHEIKEYKKAKKAPKEPRGEGYRAMAQRHGLLSTNAGPGTRKKLREDLSDIAGFDVSKYQKTPEESAAVEDAMLVMVARKQAQSGELPPDVPRESLTKKDQKALDKALARLQAEFQQEVAKETEKRLADARERKLHAAQQQAKSAQELRDVWKARVDSCKAFLHLFQDNWRTVASSVHPDRPERTREQLEKASAAMNKMKAAFEKIALDKWGS